MKNLFTVIAILIACALTINASAQFNALQTQYMYNPFVINPACAGEQGFMSATVSARKQWMGFEGAPETAVFTAHTPFKKLHHNIGLLAAADRVAVMHRTQVQAAYAYRIVTPRVNFSVGLAPGVVISSNAWSEVQTNLSGDAAFQNNQRDARFNIAYGAYMNTKRFFFGVSSNVLLKDAPTASDQPFQVYTGVRLGKPESFQVTISTLGRAMLNGYYQADVNVNCLFRNRIGGGIGYRHNDALAVMLHLKLNDQFAFGYSYDYTISNLQNYSTGSHELLLRYDFGYTVKRNSPRTF